MVNPLSDGQGNLSTILVEQALSQLQGGVNTLTAVMKGVGAANPYISEVLSQSDVVPQITGIRSKDGGPFTISFEWNPPGISNLLRYEIFVDTDPSYPSPTIIPCTSPAYDYTPPDSTLTYYFKVRGINSDRFYGQFSNILNGTTRGVATEDMLLGSTTNVTEWNTNSFSPATISGVYGVPATATYGDLTFSTKGQPIFLYAVLESSCTIAYGGGINRITATMLCDGVDVGTPSYSDFVCKQAFGLPITQAATIQFPCPILQPAAGAHTYTVRLDISNTVASYLTLTPTYLYMSTIEVRR